MSLSFRTRQSPAVLLYVGSVHGQYLAVLVRTHGEESGGKPASLWGFWRPPPRIPDPFVNLYPLLNGGICLKLIELFGNL